MAPHLSELEKAEDVADVIEKLTRCNCVSGRAAQPPLLLRW